MFFPFVVLHAIPAFSPSWNTDDMSHQEEEEDALELAGVNDLEGNAGDDAVFNNAALGEDGDGAEVGARIELSDAGALPIHKWHPHTVKVTADHERGRQERII